MYFSWIDKFNFLNFYYRQETRYYIDQYTVYQQQQCPDSQIICCADYIFVLGHCLRMIER